MAKYLPGRLVTTNGKKSIECCICGEKFRSVRITDDEKKVCYGCYKRDSDRIDIAHIYP